MSVQNQLSILIISVLIPVFVSNTYSQNFTRKLDGILFSDSSGFILNTFSGGHNNIEHQFIDIDGDGDYDIPYLDSDNTYGLYENTGDRFNPEYILSFDTIPGMKFSDWFYFVDIDDDNDFDLFTGGESALIEFRRNTGISSDPIFKPEIDTLLDDQGIPMFSEPGCNPVFADIDADGDYDFFTGNSAGTVTFYENTGNNHIFSFKFITNFWQDILIIGNTLRTRITGTAPELFLHGASALDFADIDNDSDYDLFWGDFFGRSIYYIQNNGTSGSAQMDTPYTSPVYPQNMDSVWTNGFNMPRFADIDGDNDYDLFVSVLYDPTVPESFIFYRNRGDINTPDLKPENSNLLKTLDAGIHSSPSFTDIDNDGDLDLFIGGVKSSGATLHFFENNGTAQNPSYILIDSEYFKIKGDLILSPSFGDLDGDGDLDLVTGEFLGNFSLYENTGNMSSPFFEFTGQLKDSSGNFINAGNIARPFLIDIDNDNDLDLVTGGSNGQIRLYENTGTSTEYIFIRNTDYFDQIDIGNRSAPFLFDFDGDNDLDLFTGADNVSSGNHGSIYYFRNDGSNKDPVWTLITDKFLNQTFGGYALPFFADIDNDTDKDLFIGNVKGGLYYFENTSASDVSEDIFHPSVFNLEVYPNPFNSRTNIEITLQKPDEVTISVYNILGEKVRDIFNGNLPSGKSKFTWNGENGRNKILPSGNYFIIAGSLTNLKSIKTILLK